MPMNDTPLRLLIVEAVEDDAAQIVHVLTNSGFAVTFQRVETEAALRAALEEPSWDLLTSGHTLPPFNAPAAVALAHAVCPALPILIIAHDISQSLVVELMRAGARDYIRKDDLATLPAAAARELRAAETERQRQQAEAALRESEARWQFALEGADEGVWDWNIQTGEIFFSRQWKAILGYAEDDLDHSIDTWRGLVHPDDRARIPAPDEKHRSGQMPVYRYEYRLRCKDGTYKWILDRGKVISRTPDGRPLRAIGTQTDITDRKQAEAELQRLKEFNEGIIQGMLEGIAVQDAQGRYTFVNPAACQILGRTLPELLGQPWEMVIPPDQQALVDAAHQRRRAGIQDQYELEVIRPDGQRVPVLVSGAPRFENGEYAGVITVFTDLSERNRVLRQLQASEANLRSVVQNTPWGMHFFQLTADGRLILTGANLAADAILNVFHAGLLGQTLEEAFPRFAGTEIPRHYHEAAERGTAWHTEQIGYSNGQIGSAYAIQAFQTVPEHMVAVFENILERKQAEETIQSQADILHSQNQELRLRNQELIAQGEALHLIESELRASEEKYRTLIETTDTGYVILDAAGLVRDANSEYLRLTGRQALEEILGHPVTHWTAPHDQARNAREVQTCLEEGFVRNLEIDYVDLEGRFTPVEINATVLTAAAGDMIVTLCRDITERRQAELALREGEERLLQITSTLREAVWLRDTQSLALLYVNPAYETIWGRTCESFYQNPASFLDAVHPEDKPRILQAVQAHSQGKFFNEEYRIVRPDGTQRWVWGRTFPVRNEAGEVHRITAIAEDITERRQAQKMLEDLNVRLKAEIAERENAEAQTRQLNAELEHRVAERTSQLEAANGELEAFSFSISHDLRAPLRIIDGYATILQQDYAATLPADAQTCLAGMTQNTRQMEQLIDDLLDFSRLSHQPLDKHWVAPACLAQEALDDLRAEQAGRQVEISFGDLPDCQADPALLKQVFANLLSNALKYTRRQAIARIEIGAQAQAGQNVYYVKDNGAGFDMRNAGQLFGVFQRLHSDADFEGTGIGLANVQRIIHRHGGRVWAEAEPERGATFYFTLSGGA
jgi:PAS domain S-box-containing protein